MLFQQTITTQPFLTWLIRDKENKRLLWFSVVAMIVSFVSVKLNYPYPNFMPPDSYSYLAAASNNDFINQWPIGYSKFLRLVSVFSRSHLFLVVLQYLLLMGGLLYLLFTIRYLLAPGKWLFRSLLAVSILNPLLPHIANFVSSDCLFAAISLVWFTQLLWIIAQPNLRLLLFHSLILLLAFIVRYSGLWYPFISIGIILLNSYIPKRTKWISIGAIVTPLLIFIGSTQHEYHKRTGISQYSAHAGWQVAANALYAYAHARPVDKNKVPWACQSLHAMVNQHMDSLRKQGYWPYAKIGVYYLWDPQSPLQTYLKQQQQKDSIKKKHFVSWAAQGPMYGEYGRWLIKEYPGLFLKHFVWPNLVLYYKPPPNFMSMYNLGGTTVDSLVANWFNWKNNQLPKWSQSPFIEQMDFIPTLIAILNPLFIASLLLFLSFSGLKQCSKTSKHLLMLMLLVWIANCFFSVVSAPTELRYQIFPVVITIPFCFLFMSWVVRSFQSVPKPSLA